MRSTLLRRVAALATTLGLTSLGLLGAGAAPAQAAVADCPSGYFCAWKTDDGTGTMFKTRTDLSSLGSWDNAFHAVVNHTSKFACLYDDANFSGPTYVWDPDPKGTEWGHAGGRVGSVALVSTARECVKPAYPRWYASPAGGKADFGDLNGDRRADVLVRDTAGRLWFLPGDLSGRMVGTGGWNGMSALTRHGDFSRDGREDVIAREASTGKLWLYPGTGTGGLGSRKLIGTGGWNGMAHVTAFGDLTGDGRSDLIAVQKSTGKLYLYPGTASGGLGSRKLIGTGGWNSMNALVGMGDTNGDGHPDLYAREASTGRLWFYPGTGSGGLTSRVLIGTGGWNTMNVLLSAGDVNADGHPDLVTATKADFVAEECRGVGCQLVYEGRGTGHIAPGVVVGDDWYGLNGAF
ncbi:MULTISPECIES: FG-GAP-like repeat-containing protein [unclassified Streptomyces]|uniref:FG-GAP-like repeat-containing protein n=1 Tax=unclassified Streptomyces TaxID=2593676 RepID=UPI001F043A2E|nr:MULTISPECIES: FG-GAP-like repeat-containing protein [unclassified Streptomyces]MCH0562978.1 VCBS repeat-containing protein [Streptomyces sp. MUM 2J]MCH0571938.1 VCBS repeat-containing protein [Streptomyces sp. MUM 136J]